MKSKFHPIVILVAIILLVGMGSNAVLAAQPQESVNTIYIIYPDNLQGWGFFNANGSGSNSFMIGPGTPPLGTGSIQFQITEAADELILYTYDWGGTLMSDFTSLSYSTYHDLSSSGIVTQQPAFVINIDYDRSDSDYSWQGRLVYDPYLTPGNSPVKGTWQTWNTLNGYWWATDSPGNTICPQSNPCMLSSLIASYPNSAISGGIGFKVGSGWENGFIGNVDNFVIGNSVITDTYDFEPLDPLALTDLDLLQSTNMTTWTVVPGSFADSFTLVLDPAVEWYYLDINTLTVNRALADGYYSFYVGTTPAGFLTYWASRGVDGIPPYDEPWMPIMWEIINGNQPIFFLKVTGSDYMLVDGLTKLAGGGDTPLRINGSYLPGYYYFAGDVADVFGYEDTVSVQITINDLPVVQNQTVNTAEDTAKTITLTAIDLYPGTVTWNVTQPTNGVLTGTAPNLTYTPNQDYHGPDSFTFKVNDGSVDSNTAMVTITVTPVNDAPLADDQTVATAEDTTKDIVLTATDVEGDPLTSWTIISSPTHGTLTGTAPALTYTPELNYDGPDSFTFKVNDGLVDSNIATLAITVTPVNDAPVADDQPVTTAEDTAKAIALTATDVEGGPLTWSIVAAPTHGTLTGVAPALTYTPALNYHGSDSFTFKVNDGTVDSNTATVTITDTPVNDAPIALDDKYSTDEDTALIIAAPGVLGNDTDSDNDPLTAVLNDSPTHGEFTLYANGSFIYTPDPSYIGTDSFTYHVNDGESDSNIITVTITIDMVRFMIYLPLINQ